MTKKYKLSITKDYCHDWTVENAVREIMQNMLDSPVEGAYDYSGDVLTVTSRGVSIPSKTLLLGVSTKRYDDESVGGKGEGFKLACAILLREGLSVTIYNGAVIWEPCFEYDNDFGEETLTFYEHEGVSNNNDLSFVISGLDEDTYEKVKEENLYMRDDLEKVLYGKRGSVIQDFGGKIYVGGLYVCEEPRLQYSYDFKPQYLKLNRDRKSVDNWNLRWETSLLLNEVLDKEDVIAHIKQNVYDIKSGEYSFDYSIKDACFEEFKKEYDGCVIAEYESQKEELEKKYNAKAVILDSETFANLVESSSDYKNYLEEIKKEEYEEDYRTPIDLLDMLYEFMDYDRAKEVFKQVKDVYEKRGVQWDDETIKIPF